METGESKTLDVRNVSLRFGGVRALTDVSFEVGQGELFSIIGPNGAGKTSLLNCISGRYTPTEGAVVGGIPVVEAIGEEKVDGRAVPESRDPPPDR